MPSQSFSGGRPTDIERRSESISGHISPFSQPVLATSISVSELGDSPATVTNQFLYFSVIASTNHALNYVVNAFATSLLDQQLGGIILGILWTLNSISGLTIATPVVRRLGFKYAMIISFWGYSLQIGSLYLAIRFPSCAWPIAIIGSVIAGFTSAIWWTSQGVCFELACQRIVESNRYDKFSQSIDDVRANISAYWTIIYQSCDIVVFVAMSLFPIFAHASMESVVLALTILGIVTSLLGHTFHEFGEVIDSFDIQDTLKSIAAVPRHIIFDARALLLAPFVFGFGITTAMFAYYVNSDLISSSGSLGDSYLGFLEAFSYFVATISAVPYSIVSKKFVNGQHAVIQFGSLNFLLTGVLVFSFSNSKLGSWEYMIILKALYGLGRGVFEGSCRAVYANMFAGDDLAVAFSTQTLMAGFSGGLCYFLYGVISKEAIALITMGNGILALTTYFILISHDSKSKLPWKTLFLSHDVEKTSLMNESKKNGSHLELFR